MSPVLAEEVARLADTADAMLRLRLHEQREREEAERRERDLRPQPKQLRPLGFAAMCRAVPGLIAQFERAIPAQFWNVDSGAAVIACPCGGTPMSQVGAPTSCEGCDRTYLYTGEHVRVAGGPKADAAPAQEAATPLVD